MNTFRRFLSVKLVGLLIYLVFFQVYTVALQIRASAGATINCKEVLTKNLECPSIGAYPVAGACEYFARCFQTKNGIESEVDFCPDGHIYVINRCIKSHDLGSCPQKSCPLSNAIVVEQTTVKAPFPTTVQDQMNVNGMPKPTRKPTKRPLQNLHPSRNEGVHKAQRIHFHFLPYLLSVLIITIINEVL